MNPVALKSRRPDRIFGFTVRLGHSATLSIVAVGILAAGCRTAPIQDVVDAPLPTRSTADLQGVTAAIRRAGESLGWRFQEEEPGRLIGTLYLRDHVAVVAVDYDTERFSIRHLRSQNLRQEGRMIHRNYNRWVLNLKTRIEREVMGAGL